jgi:hypothetical protein
MEDNINKDNTSNNGDTMVLNQDSIRRMKMHNAKRKYRAQLSERKKEEIREKDAAAKRNKRLLYGIEDLFQQREAKRAYRTQQFEYEVHQHVGNITDGNEVMRDPFYIDGMKSDTHVEICPDLEIEESI